MPGVSSPMLEITKQVTWKWCLETEALMGRKFITSKYPLTLKSWDLLVSPLPRAMASLGSVTLATHPSPVPPGLSLCRGPVL